MVYVLHHALALVLAAVGARAMLYGRWQLHAPRLAVAIWQTIALTVALASMGALLGLGLEPYRRGILPALGAFIHDVSHDAVPPAMTPLQVTWIFAAGVLALAVLVGTGASARRVIRRHRRLRRIVRLVGDRTDHSCAGEVRIIDHPGIAAYCIPGGRGDVVISAGVIDALSATELAAVVAHEEAHIRQRHDLVLFPFAVLARLLPWSRLATGAHRQLELLVEMCADDYAAAKRGRDELVSALRRFQLLSALAVPEGTLAAASTAVDQRCERFRRPRSRAQLVLALVALATAAVLLSTPLSLFVLPL